ncbi:hypothetical protein ACFLZ7_00490 [Nanoarchaeota archaeon]
MGLEGIVSWLVGVVQERIDNDPVSIAKRDANNHPNDPQLKIRLIEAYIAEIHNTKNGRKICFEYANEAGTEMVKLLKDGKLFAEPVEKLVELYAKLTKVTEFRDSAIGKLESISNGVCKVLDGEFYSSPSMNMERAKLSKWFAEVCEKPEIYELIPQECTDKIVPVKKPAYNPT